MADQPTKPLTRLYLLTTQYEASFEIFRDRLIGLTDEEYFWEPVAGSINVRRQDSINPYSSMGKGEWRLDFPRPEPDPPPFSTIAWRLAHIIGGQMTRYDYTFGSKSLDDSDIEYPGSANDALAMLDRSHEAWLAGLNGLKESNLDIVGLSSYPHGLDPTLPFGEILWWTNRELIHHAAEVSLLRDLWRFN